MSTFASPFGRFNILKVDSPNVTFTVEKNMKGHRHWIYTILYYGPPQNRIVSCSFDKTIRIWSSETGECLKLIENHSSWIYDLIKLKDDIFLSGSKDRTIKCYSISTFEKTKEFKMKSSVRELLKLNEDLFLCMVYSEELFILSYSQNKIVKEYYVGPNGWGYRPLLLSQKYENCFYVATQDEDETIKLVNYENDEVEKEFKNHKNQLMRSICILFNSKNEEILIACCSSQILYFYNTSHSQFNKKIKIFSNEIKKFKNRKKYPYPTDRIVTSFCFQNKYLLCGDGKGDFHFFELLGHKNSVKKTKQMRIHDDTAHDIHLFSRNHFTEFQIITSSSDNTIKITRICGMKNLFLESQDLEERVNFLMTKMEEYVPVNGKGLVEVKLRNLTLFSFKTLM